MTAVLKSMNITGDALGVSKYYHDLLSHVVIDNSDKHLVGEITALGLDVDFTNILMTSQDEKKVSPHNKFMLKK